MPVPISRWSNRSGKTIEESLFYRLSKVAKSPDDPWNELQDPEVTNLNYSAYWSSQWTFISESYSSFQSYSSGDFERPPSSIRSSSAESVRKKAPSENKVSVITDKKENKASSRATPRGKVTPKLSRLLPLPLKTASIRRYPAELYDEGRRTKFPEKAFVHRNELLTTTEEQDALVTESCEDLSFLEYRRERVLRGQKVPIGRKDLEVDVVASRLAKKLLQYEAAVDKHLPDADWVDEEEREPYDDEQALPRKPLVPIAVNPNEDPNDASFDAV
ncbi:hypothetical protein RvY_14563 [Ramazzottius varieornatus]|uniref:Uncharacterized protein n=1 Tax=Ramazzottius varieornatus TaxID=947166 RepID=A0A1D1VRS3_RAMVA|nr:hypothetical protein RvY_14563 [Ramazzottius varieornatus]